MRTKIVKILAPILLVPLPFLGAGFLSGYSPYFNDNSFGTYIALSFVYGILSFLLVWLISDKSLPKPIQIAVYLLFFCGTVMASVFGLASAPDLSINLLEHPEREHFRYLALTTGMILFVTAFAFIMVHFLPSLTKWNRWIVVFFIFALIELVWEFRHHYLFPEAMAEWIKQGNSAADFDKHYDDKTSIGFGTIGRFFQYSLVVWIAALLFQQRLIKAGALYGLSFIAVCGIVSCVACFATDFKFPKGLEILFLFFIPGAQFILLYWLGTALLLTAKPSTSLQYSV